MKLYNYFQSSASFRVRIALEWKELAYEYVPVNLMRGEHRTAEFGVISVDGLVPVLETDDGDRLSESMAIIEYLDEIAPRRSLTPVAGVARAKVRALSQSIACEIHPLHNMRVIQYLGNSLTLDEEARRAWCRHWIRDGLLSFERQLARGPASTYCWGETPTLADCCLVPQIFSAKRFNVDFSGLSRTMLAFDACMALPAFQRAQPSACPDGKS